MYEAIYLKTGVKVMAFLYSIPHQPIVCDFDSEEISINCTVVF
jgi:hypothetical protein